MNIAPALLELLKSHGEDVTEQQVVSQVVSRKEWEDHILRIFLKYFKPHPLLLGERGIGKTALFKGIIRRFVKGDVPAQLKTTKVFSFSFNLLDESFFTNLSYHHTDLKSLSRYQLLFLIDNFTQRESLMGPMAELMRAYDITICCAADKEEFTGKLETEDKLLSHMHQVALAEPNEKELAEICTLQGRNLAKHYGISIPEEMYAQVVKAAINAPLKGSLPKRSLEVLDASCSAASFQESPQLNYRHIKKGIGHISGVGDGLSSIAETRKYLESLEHNLKTEIYGQDEAIRAVCNVVKLAKNGLDLRPERPDGVFLFTGPTGVGKTALAQSLAKHLSGRTDNFIRLDMSEFSENSTLSRLLGAPPGYIGSDSDSLLFLLLQDKPSAVILLDEFEKAHPQIHNFFLQIFDAGRCTDNSGITMDMSRMTIIATSNVLDPRQTSPIGFRENESGFNYPATIPWTALKNVFPIELLNRFDEIIPFSPLNPETCRRIIHDLVIADSGNRVEERYQLTLEYPAQILDQLLEEGYSPELGFRNMQRAFQRLILLPLVDYMDSEEGKDFIGRKAKVVSLGERFSLELVKTKSEKG